MLAIEKVILLIIFLIILLVSLYFIFGIANPTGEKVELQNELRSCCPTYIANNCTLILADLANIHCGNYDFRDLTAKVGLTADQAQCFCGCGPQQGVTQCSTS